MFKIGDIVYIPDYRKDNKIWDNIGYVDTMPKRVPINTPCTILHIQKRGGIKLKEDPLYCYAPEIFKLYFCKKDRMRKIKNIKM